MTDLRFEWGSRKSNANRLKHGVSFEKANSIFFDKNALLVDDPDHSSNEDRFVMLGLSAHLRILVVCPCYRRDGAVIRIISARKAKRSEKVTYWKGATR